MSDPAAPASVSPSQHFDQAVLARYLRDRLPGFDADITVRQFQGGQSNPTFRLTTPSGDYVLRKKPAGKLLPSAHAIEREFAIMRALAGSVPLPRLYLLCEEEGVIGQPFYLMEFVEGRVMPDARLLDAEPGERHALSLELATVLARLHRVDYRKIGLEGFGRPDGYVARQLARWSRQYLDSNLGENADMNRVIAWLDANLPGDDESAIVHGDYRGHNVIFAPHEARIAAVLDWELATIGHPLVDLAYCCLPYYLPPDDLRGFHGSSPQSLGIPSEAEMTSAYCREAGRLDLPHWHFYLVFSLFRSAAIRAGVFKRVIDGTAINPEALALGQRYRQTAACAWELALTGPND